MKGRTSHLWNIVVLQGNIEVGALLFPGLLRTIAHLAGQHRENRREGRRIRKAIFYSLGQTCGKHVLLSVLLVGMGGIDLG